MLRFYLCCVWFVCVKVLSVLCVVCLFPCGQMLRFYLCCVWFVYSLVVKCCGLFIPLWSNVLRLYLCCVWFVYSLVIRCVKVLSVLCVVCLFPCGQMCYLCCVWFVYSLVICVVCGLFIPLWSNVLRLYLCCVWFVYSLVVKCVKVVSVLCVVCLFPCGQMC